MTNTTILDKKRIKTGEWRLLARYLSGEAGSRDIEQVETWLSKGQCNRELLESLKDKWHKIHQMNSIKRYDTDAAWDKLSNRIATPDEAPLLAGQPGHKGLLRKNIFIPGIAAAIILIIGVVLLMNHGIKPGWFAREHLSLETSPGSTTSVVLPDGSEIFLNADSRISYRARRFPGSREVKLTGEAFFQVKPDISRPFAVHAGNALISVVGTSFNVKTDPEHERVTVYVVSGTVGLSDVRTDRPSLFIEQGYTGLMTAQSLEKTSSADPNILSWKTGKLVFRQTKLEHVADILNNTYHIKILFEQDTIASFRFTGNFTEQPIDTVLEVLCTAFSLRYKQQDSEIMLSLAK